MTQLFNFHVGDGMVGGSAFPELWGNSHHTNNLVQKGPFFRQGQRNDRKVDVPNCPDCDQNLSGKPSSQTIDSDY